MIHEARLVTVDSGIDDGLGVHGKQEGVAVQRILALIAVIGELMAHPLAYVFDDVGALTDAAQRKDAVAMNARVANLKKRRFWAPRGLLHTAMGALIAA